MVNYDVVFEKGKISTLFAKFAIPGVVGLLFVGLLNVTDGAIVGNFAGVNALASVSLVLPVFTILTALSIMLGIGCQTLVSMNLGRKDIVMANSAFMSAFVFLFAIIFLIAFLMYLFSEEVVSMIGANDVLISESIRYLEAILLLAPFWAVFFIGDYTLKAIGRPIYSMIIMMGVGIVNVILDLIFVGVFEWGTRGAALATGIAFSLGSIVSMCFIFSKKSPISMSLGRFKMSLVWKMLYNGSSEGVTELSAGIMVLVYNVVMMSMLGENGVAAFAIVNYVIFIGITIFLGMSDGIIPIISYNFGAKHFDRIKKTIFLAMRINIIIGILIFVFLLFFGENMVLLFMKENNEDIISIAVNGAMIYCSAFLFNGFNIMTSGFFTALGNAKISIIVSLFRGLIFMLLFISILPSILGINGVWLAVPMAEFATLFVSIALLNRQFSKMGLSIREKKAR